MNIVIRRAVPYDARQLAALNSAFNEVDTSAEHIAQSLAHNAQEAVFVAECDGEIVGFCCGRLFATMCYENDFAEATEIYVAETHRRHGIGALLIERYEKHFAEMGAKTAEVFTGKTNTAARAFYESIGYKGHDVVFYERDIEPGNGTKLTEGNSR